MASSPPGAAGWNGGSPNRCLNCEATLVGAFCSQCGQKVVPLEPSVKELLADLLSNLWSWDSRVARTLAALVRRPGALTEEYCRGRRVRYVSPGRLYLVCSLTLFLVVSLMDFQVFQTSVSPETQAGAAREASSAPVKIWFTEKEDEAEESPKGVAAEAPSEAPSEASSEASAEASEETTDRRHRFAAKAVRAAENPEGINTFILSKLPQALFLMIPLYALLFKIIHWRFRRVYAQHFVFVLHFHSVLFLLLTVRALSPLLPIPTAVPAALITGTIFYYLYSSLRRVYEGSVVGTLVRIFALGVGYGLVTSLTISILGLLAIWRS